MASQGERELGVLGMDEGVLESMAQDGDPEQEMLVVQEHELPQPDPEPEMSAAAAAVYDTSPPPLHQNLPILAESTQSSTPNMAQLFAMLAGMNATMQQMQSKMDTNARNLMDRMDAHTQAFKSDMRTQQGELQQIGRGLQAGIMATPRAGTNELGGVQRLSGPQWRRVRTG